MIAARKLYAMKTGVRQRFVFVTRSSVRKLSAQGCTAATTGGGEPVRPVLVRFANILLSGAG